jgi:hypothetical protein
MSKEMIDTISSSFQPSFRILQLLSEKGQSVNKAYYEVFREALSVSSNCFTYHPICTQYKAEKIS